MSLDPCLKYPGGKGPIASWIVSLMPPRCKTPNKPDPKDKGWLHYVEAYCGGCAVLLANDPEGISEVVNDTYGELTNFWRVMQQDKLFAVFAREMQATPFSQQEWKDSLQKFDPAEPVAGAINFFIRIRQAHAGRTDSFAALTKNRCRRGMNEQASAWLSAVDGLAVIHARMMRVAVLNDKALKVIKKEDWPRTLFYLDPPYLHDTRVSTDEYGVHEMTVEEHEDLLAVLSRIEGRFLLSGYRSDLYDGFAKKWGWERHDRDVANHASGQKTKPRKVECIWANYDRKTYEKVS